MPAKSAAAPTTAVTSGASSSGSTPAAASSSKTTSTGTTGVNGIGKGRSKNGGGRVVSNGVGTEAKKVNGKPTVTDSATPAEEAPTNSSSVIEDATPSSSTAKSKSKSRTSRGTRSRLGAARGHTTTLPYTSIVSGAATKLPIVFTRDADFFCIVEASSVKIHSRTTGEVVSTLSARITHLSDKEARDRTHIDAITGLMLHPQNPFQLITSSLDGTIKVWDYLDAFLLKNIDVGWPVTHLAAHPTVPDVVFVATRKPKASSTNDKPDPYNFIGKTNSIIYSVSMAYAGAGKSASPASQGQGGVPARKSREMLRLGKTRDASGLQISPDGKWLVAIGNRKVQIANTASLKSGFTKFVAEENLVSLAFHPTESVFATGGVSGKIRLWHCLNEAFIAASQQTGAEKTAPSTLYHWHAHAVSSLAFTPNGAHLVSGGEEAVLVLWQMSSQQREYVPRLGAPINSIAIADGMDGREQEFVMGLADGSVVFVGALNLKANRTFARVKIDPTRALLPATKLASIPAPLAIEPLTGQVVMTAGHPSSLQFFDPVNERITSEVEVSPSNRVSRPDEAPIEPFRVEKIAFSSTPAAGALAGPAEWMATVDARQAGQLTSEMALKIWRWDVTKGRYLLNTRIDSPHESGINSLAFSPQRSVAAAGDDDEALATAPLLVTTGRDHKVRTWKLTAHSARGNRREVYWSARSVFGYRDTLPTQVVWSPDASLIAVAQGAFITLWEPTSNALTIALSCPELKSSVQFLNFVGRAGRYIVAAGSRVAVVWDLVQGRVRWHTQYSADESAIQAVVPVSNGLAFAVLRHSRTAGSGSTRGRGKESTIVDVYDPSTEIAASSASYLVPLKIREAASVVRSQTHRSSLTALSTAPPTFVAISHDFNVYQVGFSPSSSVSSATESAQNLRGATVKRRTLFDDLFGSSTLEDASGTSASDLKTQSDLNKKASKLAESSKDRTDRLKDVFELFDAPSHLLPPIGMLFDAVAGAFLGPPMKGREPSEGEKVGKAETENTRERAVSTLDTPVEARMDESEQPRPRRREQPFEEMVEMFREVLAMPPAAPPAAAAAAAPSAEPVTKGSKAAIVDVSTDTAIGADESVMSARSNGRSRKSAAQRGNGDAADAAATEAVEGEKSSKKKRRSMGGQ